MATYTKFDKGNATYTKLDKADTEKGWFKRGWFLDWLEGFLYRKVDKGNSTYAKVDK